MSFVSSWLNKDLCGFAPLREKSIMGRKTFISCICLAVLLVAPLFARADEEFKITPDVVYGHKAGMALTFDVIQPKSRTAPASCSWSAAVGFRFGCRPKRLWTKSPAFFRIFNDLSTMGLRCSSSGTAARRSSKCQMPWPMSAARHGTSI